jgi:prepilin-type N-terminal cleavage/methylation domain-containing protein
MDRSATRRGPGSALLSFLPPNFLDLNMQATFRRRRGFTLVELLVVIAIIGVLVALLLPAVQAAREAARRTDCTNRMRQIGIACMNYHDAQGTFPLASSLGPPTAGLGTMMSYVAQILPYVEQQNLQNLVDLKLNWANVKNKRARETPLPSFRCPTQEPTEPTYVEPSSSVITDSELRVSYHGVMGAAPDINCPPSPQSIATMPGSSYELAHGLASPDPCCSGGGSATNGLIVPPSDTICASGGPKQRAAHPNVSIKSATDGTTNTFLVGELAWDAGAQRVWLVSTSSSTYHNTFNYTSKHIAWPLNTANRAMAAEPALASNNEMSFGSKHPSGCHFVMGDASVHFVNQDIELAVLKALASRASEEKHTSPF